MARAKPTLKRDTIIELEDRETGYRARLKVPAQTLNIAQSKPVDVQDRKAIGRAQAAICIQAKSQMARAGRPQHRWLAWSDIAGSVTEVAHLGEALPVRTPPLQG